MAFRKFKFVEEFIDPKTGQPYENPGSPKRKETKYFGLKELHQIAKIVYQSKVTMKPSVTIDEKTGKTVEGPVERVVTYDEIMGEKGGWIERMDNLAQGGNCWVSEGAVVCEEAFVSEDAQISGSAEIGGHAKIGGKAKVYEEGSASEGAYIFGNAKVHGGERTPYTAVMGLARVEGEVGGEAMVLGNAKVGPHGQVLGKSVVRGFSQIYGKVDGKSAVSGNAIVYGEVKGESSVSGDAIIMEDAVVSGESSVGDLATIYGRVAGESSVMGNCRVGEDGTVQDAASNGNSEIDGTITEANVSGNSHVLKKASVGKDSSLDGNATVSASVGRGCSVIDNGRVNGKMNQSKVSGNGEVGSNGNMSKSEIDGNTTIGGSFENSTSKGGSILTASANGSNIVGCALVEGALSRAKVAGASYVGGGVKNGKVEGSAVVAEGGEVNGGAATGNARVLAKASAKVDDNACLLASSSKAASGNSVQKYAEATSGNEVCMEKPEGEGARDPQGAAVLCKVEPE